MHTNTKPSNIEKLLVCAQESLRSMSLAALKGTAQDVSIPPRHLRQAEQYLWLDFWGSCNFFRGVLLLRKVNAVAWAPELQNGPVVRPCGLCLIIIVPNVLHLQTFRPCYCDKIRAFRPSFS